MQILRTKGQWDNETGTCPCHCWNRAQHDWYALIDKVGSEEAAKKELVRRLRQIANHIESLCEGSFIETVSVTLSFPWPG